MGLGRPRLPYIWQPISNSAGKTVLIDGDDNHSAIAWAKRGRLPFPWLMPVKQPGVARQFERRVLIDTQARPSQEDLKELSDGCDLLVIPSTPDALSLDALMLTVAALRSLRADRYKILLAIIPPKPSRDGEEARGMLAEESLPVFAGGIGVLQHFKRPHLLARSFKKLMIRVRLGAGTTIAGLERRYAAVSKFSGLRQSRSADSEISPLLDVQKSTTADTEGFELPQPKLGRPRREQAKHRHPDFRQVTAYIRRDTYAQVRSRLFNQEREFSDLVQDLLTDWLNR